MTKRLLIIFSCFMFLMLILALILYFSGVRGSISVSPRFTAYVNRVVNDVENNNIMIIPSSNKIEYLPTNDWWDYIANAGIAVANGVLTIVNVASSVWNFQVKVVKFIIFFVTSLSDFNADLFEVDDTTWWWQDVGTSGFLDYLS